MKNDGEHYIKVYLENFELMEKEEKKDDRRNKRNYGCFNRVFHKSN